MSDFDEAAWRREYLGEEVRETADTKFLTPACSECMENKKIVARGLCMKCYQRMRRAGELGHYQPSALDSKNARRDAFVTVMRQDEDEWRDLLFEFGYVAISFEEYKEFVRLKNNQIGIQEG
jgi:hypothetical protein